MDGANMNAQVGLTSPAAIGADVCHLNLHKTFAIPHGGGGPGMGPIAVAAHLAPYLPGHRARADGRRARRSTPSRARRGAARASCSSPTPTSRMLGGAGMTDATKYAILNANYIKARLKPLLPGALHERPRAVRPRDDLRPARLQGGGHRGGRRRQAADGLRLPRADRVVPGAGHADGRADRERAEGRTGPLLRRDDRHPPGDPGRHRRQGRSEGQRAEERAAHGGGRDRRHLDAPVLARAGGLPAAVRARRTSSGRASGGSTTRTATATSCARARRWTRTEPPGDEAA